MIDARGNKRRRNKSGKGALHIKIRLSRKGKKQPTRAEAIKALDTIIETGHAKGWKYYGIDWARPGGRGGSGGLNELRAFKTLILAMGDSLQFAFVREPK